MGRGRDDSDSEALTRARLRATLNNACAFEVDKCGVLVCEAKPLPISRSADRACPN